MRLYMVAFLASGCQVQRCGLADAVVRCCRMQYEATRGWPRGVRLASTHSPEWSGSVGLGVSGLIRITQCQSKLEKVAALAVELSCAHVTTEVDEGDQKWIGSTPITVLSTPAHTEGLAGTKRIPAHIEGLANPKILNLNPKPIPPNQPKP